MVADSFTLTTAVDCRRTSPVYWFSNAAASRRLFVVCVEVKNWKNYFKISLTPHTSHVSCKQTKVFHKLVGFMCKHGVLACLCIAMRKRVYNSIKRIQKKRREMSREKKSFSCFAYITCALVISCAALFVRSRKSRLFSLRLLKKVTEHRERIVYTYMGRRTSSASHIALRARLPK